MTFNPFKCKCNQKGTSASNNWHWKVKRRKKKKKKVLLTSGAIHGYVPTRDILVVLLRNLEVPKSQICNISKLHYLTYLAKLQFGAIVLNYMTCAHVHLISYQIIWLFMLPKQSYVNIWTLRKKEHPACYQDLHVNINMLLLCNGNEEGTCPCTWMF